MTSLINQPKHWKENFVSFSCWLHSFYLYDKSYQIILISQTTEEVPKFKWENAMTIDEKSWGFRANAPLSDYLTIEELIETLVKTVR